jgi:NAD(P)-dependent dehydrogenase (short-subunit alcohol dehydrogenase family)
MEIGYMKELTGKVALVTGGGRGLGQQICMELAEGGAAVIAADVRSELADNVAQQIRRAGGRAMAMRIDVSEPAEAEQCIGRVVAEFGQIDALVNNAGIDKTCSIEELSVEEWTRILAVNLTGPFLMSKHALPVMASRQGGHIVNVVSTAAKRTWANAAAYHASKWGLLGFSHALHVEARKRGVKVTALVVGGMRTPFLLERFPDIDPSVLQDPRNVAATVRFLLTQPAETVIPEMMVLPMRETSWP